MTPLFRTRTHRPLLVLTRPQRWLRVRAFPRQIPRQQRVPRLHRPTGHARPYRAQAPLGKVPGGYQIHDFKAYQPTRYEVVQRAAATPRPRPKQAPGGALQRPKPAVAKLQHRPETETETETVTDTSSSSSADAQIAPILSRKTFSGPIAIAISDYQPTTAEVRIRAALLRQARSEARAKGGSASKGVPKIGNSKRTAKNSTEPNRPAPYRNQFEFER
jgi:hypothetical protein